MRHMLIGGMCTAQQRSEANETAQRLQLPVILNPNAPCRTFCWTHAGLASVTARDAAPAVRLGQRIAGGAAPGCSSLAGGQGACAAGRAARPGEADGGAAHQSPGGEWPRGRGRWRSCTSITRWGGAEGAFRNGCLGALQWHMYWCWYVE